MRSHKQGKSSKAYDASRAATDVMPWVEHSSSPPTSCARSGIPEAQSSATLLSACTFGRRAPIPDGRGAQYLLDCNAMLAQGRNDVSDMAVQVFAATR